MTRAYEISSSVTVLLHDDISCIQKADTHLKKMVVCREVMYGIVQLIYSS